METGEAAFIPEGYEGIHCTLAEIIYSACCIYVYILVFMCTECYSLLALLVWYSLLLSLLISIHFFPLLSIASVVRSSLPKEI